MTNKKDQKNIIKRAFSIFEMGIVLIVVGFLVGGIVGGQSLIKSAKLAKAKSLTNSAPVLTVEDLTLWLETTLDQ